MLVSLKSKTVQKLSPTDGEPIIHMIVKIGFFKFRFPHAIFALKADTSHKALKLIAKLKPQIQIESLNSELIQWIMFRSGKISRIRSRFKNSTRSNHIEGREKKAANIGAFTHVFFESSGFVFKNLLSLPLGKSGESE